MEEGGARSEGLEGRMEEAGAGGGERSGSARRETPRGRSDWCLSQERDWRCGFNVSCAMRARFLMACECGFDVWCDTAMVFKI